MAELWAAEPVVNYSCKDRESTNSPLLCCVDWSTVRSLFDVSLCTKKKNCLSIIITLSFLSQVLFTF